VVQSSKARGTEVLIVGMHLEARESREVILTPFPGISKHIVEPSLTGRQSCYRGLTAIRQLEISPSNLQVSQ
jgi:hypothetical protein